MCHFSLEKLHDDECYVSVYFGKTDYFRILSMEWVMFVYLANMHDNITYLQIW